MPTPYKNIMLLCDNGADEANSSNSYAHTFSVVTVSLFSRSVGVGQCFHEKVGGRCRFRCLYMFTKRRCMAFMNDSLVPWA